MSESSNHVGLYSEYINPTSRAMWGNFPHTTAMVGMITSALTVSKLWSL